MGSRKDGSSEDERKDSQDSMELLASGADPSMEPGKARQGKATNLGLLLCVVVPVAPHVGSAADVSANTYNSGRRLGAENLISITVPTLFTYIHNKTAELCAGVNRADAIGNGVLRFGFENDKTRTRVDFLWPKPSSPRPISVQELDLPLMRWPTDICPACHCDLKPVLTAQAMQVVSQSRQ